jgi:hypothetical protein
MSAIIKGVVNIHGNDYFTVARRVFDFRQQHPASDGWGIQTEIISIDADRVVMKASIVSPTGQVVGTGFAEEVRSSSKINRTSALENCETSCIGRAVFAATAVGFEGSTQYASADEVVNAVAQQTAAPTVESLTSRTQGLRAAPAPTNGSAPACPKCGDEMWDNSDKRRQAQQKNQKAPPAYKCKKNKWDSKTKKSVGCEGIVWDAVAAAVPFVPQKDDEVTVRDIIEPDRFEDYESEDIPF